MSCTLLPRLPNKGKDWQCYWAKFIRLDTHRKIFLRFLIPYNSKILLLGIKFLIKWLLEYFSFEFSFL